MASNKKGKRTSRRLVDEEQLLDEAPGADIEPGQALDEMEPLSEVPVKKVSKATDGASKTIKVPRKAAEKGPSVWESVVRFLKDVQGEGKKIVWPDSEHQWNSTGVVVGTIFAVAAFMGIFSSLFAEITNRVFLPNTQITQPADQNTESVTGTDENGEVDGGGKAGDGVPAGAEGQSQRPQSPDAQEGD